MQSLVFEKVLADSDEGGLAIAELPHDYSGPCIVEVEGRTRKTLGFPSVSEAESAAKFAVGNLGGFHRAIVRPGTTAEEDTFQTWSDWAFS